MRLRSLLALLLTAGPLLGADADIALREACAKRSSEMPIVRGSDGWFFLPSELRHVGVGKFWGEAAIAVSKSKRPENADPLPAILDFQKQLDAVGVELILLPVPAKAFVYPEAILGTATTGPAPERLDLFHQEFYEELRKNGVTVIDLLPDFLAQRNASEGHTFCKQDSHWSGQAVIHAAETIMSLLDEKEWLKDVPRTEYSATTRELEIEGDLWVRLESDKPAKERLKLRFVGTPESQGAAPVPADPASPVVLLGDSHTLVFNAGADLLAEGAGLPDQLALDLGFPVDLIGVRGSGATAARVNFIRRIRADPSYLAGKKVVIWCFTARELTESTGWSVLPLLP